jgi:hypothetical protein
MNDSESEDQHVAREPIEPVKEEPVAKPSSRPSSSRRPRSAGKNLRINTPHSRPTPRPRTESTKSAVLATTPTQANTRIPLPRQTRRSSTSRRPTPSHNTERAHTPHLRRISSGASVSALKGASPTPPASATTQESMSSAGVPIQPTNERPTRPPSSMTTDNDEDDFQSAYSTSPRGERFSSPNQLSGSDQDVESAIAAAIATATANHRNSHRNSTHSGMSRLRLRRLRARRGKRLAASMMSSVTMLPPFAPEPALSTLEAQATRLSMSLRQQSHRI